MKEVIHFIVFTISTLLLVCFPYITYTQVIVGQPEERLVLSTDRDIYIAGEELLFSVDIFKIKDKANISEVGYVLLRNANQTVISSVMVRFIEGRAWSSITLPDTLSSGYFQLVAYTNYLRNFSFAIYPTKQIIVANRFDKELNIFSVDDIDSLPKIERSSFLEISASKSSYLPLEKGIIILKAIKESAKVSVSIMAEELFAGNLTCFNSLNIDIKNTNQCFRKEIKGVYISGYLTSKGNNKPLPNVIIYLSTPDSLVNLQYTKTDLQGYFCFHLSYAYLNRKVFVIPDIPSISEEVIVKIDDKNEVSSPFIPLDITLSTNQLEFIRKSQNIVLVQKLFRNSPISSFDPNGIVKVTLPRVYATPNYEYVLSNYEPLNDLKEITREIIPQVRLRGRGEEQNLFVMNTQESYAFFSSPPIVFLNGMPFAKPLSLLNYSSKEIEKIEVISVPWYFGEKLFNGIISIFLVPQISSTNLFGNGSSEYLIQPFAFQAEYDYEQFISGPGIPDFRQTLLWKPSVFVNSNECSQIDFTTSHLQGNYIIVVSGFDTNGNMIFETHSINVKE